jgi:hypothetical protein
MCAGLESNLKVCVGTPTVSGNLANYSLLRATNGSTREARQAGK